MLLVNPSIEDISNYPYQPRTSQVNPNLSTTNIFQLNHPKAVRANLASLGSITPPASNASTPVFDKREGLAHFDRRELYQNLGGSTTSLDTYMTSVETQHQKVAERGFLPSINLELTTMCLLWYSFSIVSSNTTKAVLLRFPYAVTLTQCQFVLNAVLCVAFFRLLVAFPGLTRHFPRGSIPNLHELDHSVMRLLTPSSFVISTTLPMGIFQFLGHVTSHKATEMIPVSLVHTVKALSPMTTVAIYRIVYRANFSYVTYVTLLPLMAGIMLTCYKPKKAASAARELNYIKGLVFAFASMFIFVTQNIFAKKSLTYKSAAESDGISLPKYKGKEEKKVDKLTILLYCSVIGFLFTLPLYIVTEWLNPTFLLLEMNKPLIGLIFVNGVSHFMQSLLAFLLLGTISPINYSIASIMKRISVIICAFIWESNFSFTGTQTYGILLTVAGLYCYDKWGKCRKQ